MNSIHYLATTVDRAFHHNSDSDNDNSPQFRQQLNETHSLLKQIEDADEAGEGDESDDTEFKNFNLLNTPQEKKHIALDDSDVVTRAEDVAPHTSFPEDDDGSYEDSEQQKIYQEAQRHRASILRTVFNILFFLPNNLIIKPIAFIILVITYPLRVLYGILFRNKKSPALEIAETISNKEELESQDDNTCTNNHDNTTHSRSSAYQQNSNGESGDVSLRSQRSNVSNSYNSNFPTIAEDELEFDSTSFRMEDDQIKSPTTNIPVEESSDTENIEREKRERQFTPDQTAISPQSAVSTPRARTLRTSSQLSQSHGQPRRRFLFPKLLFNFNISNPPTLPVKTLVLDLDETLIHSLSRHNTSVLGKNGGTTIEIKLSNKVATLYYIYKRPYVDEFLSIVRQWYNLVCFTASIKEYADPVINFLESEVQLRDKDLKNKFNPNNKVFSRRFYRDSCVLVEGKGYIKDLGVLCNRQRPSFNRSNSGKPSASTSTPDLTYGPSRAESHSPSRDIPSRDSSRSRTPQADVKTERRDRDKEREDSELGKVIIIDNSPISYNMHRENGLMIEGWINDPDDLELMNLLPLLNSLRFTSDVRTVLGLKNGQVAFE